MIRLADRLAAAERRLVWTPLAIVDPMRTRLLLSALSLCVAVACSRAATGTAGTAGTAPAPALSNDRAAVLASIDTFLVGLRTKDTAIMSRFVDSTTRMTLLRPLQTGGYRVWVMTGPQFITTVSAPNGPFLDEPIRNPVVHVDGDLASVWAEYQVRINGAVSHCGFDAFHLVRKNGRWMFLNLSDTFRRTGCGEPWPQ